MADGIGIGIDGIDGIDERDERELDEKKMREDDSLMKLDESLMKVVESLLNAFKLIQIRMIKATKYKWK